MGSVFINAGLAAGVALAAVPVILHLFMKQTPKHVVFPALRLIRERQKRSRKTLRIKNWLLLLARMALLALMALALARPRMDAKVKAGAQEVETALALVFDTSLSMGYKEHDKTRLDEAKERAGEILQRAHAGSEVFVIDSADAGTPPALSPASARKRVEALKVRAANRPMNQAVGLAYSAVAGSDKPEHDVYVLTDLSRSSWKTDQKVEGLDRAEKVKGGVATFLLRIGEGEPHDVAIVHAEPTSGLASEDEPVAISARLRAIGKEAERIVEYYVDGQKKAQKLVKIPANAEVDAPAFSPRLP
ncbi:MAG TPA: VWA domain-containing protein, partial [Isosphaeraceae bacterium]|nr:VWA domain-containing protein [Isosphaeraceae bacterium]